MTRDPRRGLSSVDRVLALPETAVLVARHGHGAVVAPYVTHWPVDVRVV